MSKYKHLLNEIKDGIVGGKMGVTHVYKLMRDELYEVERDFACRDVELQKAYTALRSAYIELSGKASHDSDCAIHNNPDHMPDRCNCND